MREMDVYSMKDNYHVRDKTGLKYPVGLVNGKLKLSLPKAKARKLIGDWLDVGIVIVIYFKNSYYNCKAM